MARSGAVAQGRLPATSTVDRSWRRSAPVPGRIGGGIGGAVL